MPLASASHDTSGLISDTHAITGTSTGTKCHIISLNNHLNMPNAMVSLAAPSASVKDCNMRIQKTIMLIINEMFTFLF